MYVNVIVPEEDLREIREAIYFQLATAWDPADMNEPEGLRDNAGLVLPEYLPGGEKYPYTVGEWDTKLYTQLLKIDEMIRNNNRT